MLYSMLFSYCLLYFREVCYPDGVLRVSTVFYVYVLSFGFYCNHLYYNSGHQYTSR